MAIRTCESCGQLHPPKPYPGVIERRDPRWQWFRTGQFWTPMPPAWVFFEDWSMLEWMRWIEVHGGWEPREPEAA